jgi:hypothetical protein
MPHLDAWDGRNVTGTARCAHLAVESGQKAERIGHTFLTLRVIGA